MADDLDKAQEYMDFLSARDIALVQRAALNIPKGEPGECQRCGEDSPRLVNGVCAPCRDKWKLP